MRKTLPIADYFWPKVDKTPGLGPGGACWEWTASTNGWGYGKIGSKRRTIAAHRLSWEIHNGPIPDGLFVLHDCDNRRCVNPGHLFLGTQADNNRDKIAKGRHGHGAPHGEHQHSAKLTTEKVLSIRSRWPGVSQAALAREFGVAPPSIKKVITRKSWAHV